MAFGVHRIPGSDRVRDLRDGNGNRLPRNPRLELHDRRLFVRAETGHVQDAILMGFLVFLENGDRILVGMIVNELVALRAEQHQVGDIVDVRGTEGRFAARPVLLEGDDMRHLREIPRSQCQRMLQQVFVVIVEFAAPAGTDHQKQAGQVTNAAADADDRRCRGGGDAVGLLRRFCCQDAITLVYYQSVQCKRT